jgi:hypothetical protein
LAVNITAKSIDGPLRQLLFWFTCALALVVTTIGVTIGVEVGVEGTFVGARVAVGNAVLVGTGVFVGCGIAVGVGIFRVAWTLVASDCMVCVISNWGAADGVALLRSQAASRNDPTSKNEKSLYRSLFIIPPFDLNWVAFTILSGLIVTA